MNLGSIDEKLARLRAEEEDYLEAEVDVVAQVTQEYRWDRSGRSISSSMQMAKYIRLREDKEEYSTTGYTYDYYLKIMPHHSETYFAPITVSEAASFVEFDSIIGVLPDMSPSTIEYIRSNNNLHIRNFKTVEIENDLNSLVSMTTGQSSFSDNRRGFGHHHRDYAVSDAKTDLREAWTKQENCHTIECTVSEHKTSYSGDSKILVEHPSWKRNKMFRIDSEDADKDHIRAFANEVGGGLLENIEGEKVIVSINDYNDPVSTADEELYLYAPSQVTFLSQIKNRATEILGA